MNANHKSINPATFAKTAKPVGPHIGAGAKRLYALEAKRTNVITACIEEQMKVMGLEKGQYWTHGVPEGLFSVLETYQQEAAARAAQAFLEQYGFTVIEPKTELKAVS